MIGVLLPFFEFHYANTLFAGLESALSSSGYHVVIRKIEKAYGDETVAVRDLIELGVEGLAIVAIQDEHFMPDILRLVLDDFPLVFVEKNIRDLKANNVYSDTEKAGFLMGSYLAAQADNPVGLVTYPSQFSLGVKERTYGFQMGLVQNGLSPLSEDNQLIVPFELLRDRNQLDEHFECAAITDFITQRTELKAIAAADAFLAKLVCRACEKSGRDDMKVVCVDYPAFHSQHVYPIAYVDQSPYELGQSAANVLISAIHSQEKQEIVLQPKLVETRA
ncbi:hypothetical protein KCTCHS21_44350 [Cohnella abietis]|uniref:Periplasmic binding protein/LacI sugar binding domain-containing protein n=1 Tax=Cohnella abietis TaxID=2507935 RepID=A0A3T1DA93_9BACL|nr:hypothetical protein KCTCHS21_44350 [Cohnella abietis]